MSGKFPFQVIQIRHRQKNRGRRVKGNPPRTRRRVIIYRVPIGWELRRQHRSVIIYPVPSGGGFRFQRTSFTTQQTGLRRRSLGKKHSCPIDRVYLPAWVTLPLPHSHGVLCCSPCINVLNIMCKLSSVLFANIAGSCNSD